MADDPRDPVDDYRPLIGMLLVIGGSVLFVCLAMLRPSWPVLTVLGAVLGAAMLAVGVIAVGVALGRLATPDRRSADRR